MIYTTFYFPAYTDSLYELQCNKNFCMCVSGRACERSWAVRIPAPRSRGCSLPRSTAQSRSRPRRSIPLPAHLQFQPAPVKSLHARSNLKFLCILTPAVFNRSLTPGTHCLRDGRGAGLLRNCCGKSASLLFCRGGRGCGVVGPRTWYAHIPQAVWLLQGVGSGRAWRAQARPLWWKAPPSLLYKYNICLNNIFLIYLNTIRELIYHLK